MLYREQNNSTNPDILPLNDIKTCFQTLHDLMVTCKGHRGVWSIGKSTKTATCINLYISQ